MRPGARLRLDLPPLPDIAGEHSACSFAAHERTRSRAAFAFPDAPDVRIAARSARLYLDAALFGEGVAAVALRRRRAARFGLVGATTARRIAGAALTLLGACDATARRTRRMKGTDPGGGGRAVRVAGAARQRYDERDQRRVGAPHYRMVPVSGGTAWVGFVSETAHGSANRAPPRGGGRAPQK